MTRKIALLTALVLLMAMTTPVTALAGPPSGRALPEELRGASPRWSAAHLQEADRQLKYLTSAYDLDESMRQQVREELYQRVAQEREFQLATNAELDVLVERMQAIGGEKEAEAVLNKMRDIGNATPMNENTVARWLEARLPAEKVAPGRQRLEELRQQRERRRQVSDGDLGRRQRAARLGARARAARQAQQTVNWRPMPRGPKAEEPRRKVEKQAAQRFVRPDRAAVDRPKKGRPKLGATAKAPSGKADRTARSPTKAKARPAAKAKRPDVRLPPAPPLDEWDKYVARIAEKYGFTDSQVTKAQSILRDLRRRAYQYQMSRAADFARAELMLDKKAQTQRFGELNRPLNALFDELKRRLESLPTMEQRQRAKEPRSGKKGK